MQTERKELFTRRDLIAILLLLGCLTIGCIVIFVQKASKKVPPQLGLETSTQLAINQSEVDHHYFPDKSIANLMVNINTAGKDSLELLPGIGPAFAEKIIAYRDEHGAFKSKEQLVDIAGIGQQTLEKIMELITLE